MEVKKAPKANLENKKSIFFETGLMIALAVILVSFEWRSPADETLGYISDPTGVIDEDIMVVTKFEEPKPLPPPPPELLRNEFIITEKPTLDDDDIVFSQSDDNSANTVKPIFEEKYDPEDTGEDDVFVVVEEVPKFMGGEVQQWIGKNVKYPSIAAENGVQGKVYVQFVIEKDGSVSNVNVLRGVDASLDKEAVRVIQAMPKWKPGKQRGSTVRVSYTLPINFRLSSN